MSLTQKQVDYIVSLDNKGKKSLESGDEWALLASLPREISKIKDIMALSSEGELDFYCALYEGFSEYMRLLEKMAVVAEGAFDELLL